MKLTINDPRQYSNVYPESNILINQAQYDLDNHADNGLLKALLGDTLKDGNDQLLSVAYNLAPTQQIADYLWHSLQEVLNPEDCQLELFAYPLVLIVGSTTQVQLPNQINQAQLQQLLQEKNILPPGEGGYISGKLFDVNGLSRIKPSQLYAWNNQLTLAEWIAICENLSHPAVVNVGEGVHLRFLVGARVPTADLHPLDSKEIATMGMDLLKLLNNDLKTDGVTLFPLPFPACRLSQAVARGEFHRQEIDVSLNLSNLVKKLRQNGQAPFMKISSQKNNLQLEVWCPEATEAEEILLWRIQRSDDFAMICEIVGSLLVDMHLQVEYYPEHDHDEH